MAFCVIHSKTSQHIAEKLSLQLHCEPEWGDISEESLERRISKADVIVILVDDNCLREIQRSSSERQFLIWFYVARARQVREEVKLIQPLLWKVTEDRYTREFPFSLPGLPCLTVVTDHDSEISDLAAKIRSRITEARDPLCSPLLIHLNAYEGASSWANMISHHPQALYVELCKTSEYQANNRHLVRHWSRWKQYIDDTIVEQAEICAKYNVEVHVTGAAPLSLYMYLGMRLNRVPTRLWHVKTLPLGDCSVANDTKPDIYDVKTSANDRTVTPGDRSVDTDNRSVNIDDRSDTTDDRSANTDDKSVDTGDRSVNTDDWSDNTDDRNAHTSEKSEKPQHEKLLEIYNTFQTQGCGRIAILVTLNPDHELSERDLDSMNLELESKHSNTSVISAFLIRPRKDKRIDLNVSNFDQIRLEVRDLFQECLRRVPKDSNFGLNLSCSGPTPLSFFVGTLIHPHQHGEVWCMEYQNRKYVAALCCTTPSA